MLIRTLGRLVGQRGHLNHRAVLEGLVVLRERKKGDPIRSEGGEEPLTRAEKAPVRGCKSTEPRSTPPPTPQTHMACLSTPTASASPRNLLEMQIFNLQNPGGEGDGGVRNLCLNKTCR